MEHSAIHFPGKNIRNRLLISSVLFCILFLLMEVGFSFFFMRSLLLESYRDQDQTSANQIRNTMSTRMELLEISIQSLASSMTVSQMLTEPFDGTQYQKIYHNILSLDTELLNRFNDNDNISQFILVGRNGFAMDSSLLYRGKYLGFVPNFASFCQTLDEQGMLMDTPRPCVFLSCETPDSTTAGIFAQLEGKTVLSCPLKNMHGSADGILFLVLDDDFFKDIFSSQLDGKSIRVYDDKGQLIWPAQNALPFFTDEKTILEHYTLDSYGLEMQTEYPLKNIMKPYEDTTLSRLLFLLLIQAWIIPVSIFFSRKISAPLRTLSQKLQQDFQLFQEKDFQEIWMPGQSLRNKIILFYIISVFLPNLLFMSMISYQNYRVYNHTIEHYMFSALKQAKSNLDKVLDNYEQFSLSLAYSMVDIDNLIDNHDFSALEEEFFSLRFSQPDLLGVGIIDWKGRTIYETSHANSSLLSDTAPLVLERLKGSNGRLSFVGVQKTLYNNRLFVFARPLRSIRNFRRIGYCVYFIDPDAFTSILTDTNLAGNSYYLLLDQENHMIASTVPSGYDSFSGEEFALLNSADSVSFPIDGTVGRNLLFFDGSGNHLIKIAGVIPLSEISGQVFSQLWVSFLLLLSIILIIIVISCLLSLSMTKPLKELRREMALVSRGNFDISMEYDSHDEIGILAHYFNDMVKRLKALIEENYQSKIREKELMYLEKEAQLNALQQQINPHFLYNTLESIKWMAYMDGCREICDMATALGKFFRYAIVKEHTLVSLSDELENLKNYLYIQKIRYKDKFDVQWAIPEELLECRMEKLIFQPLVENAIIHGIEQMKTGGIIRIEGRREGAYLYFSVSDNGAGMSAEQLSALQSRFHLHKDEYPNASIGVVNVYKRLCLYYHDNITFDIDSVPGEGTSVKFKIPAAVSEG